MRPAKKLAVGDGLRFGGEGRVCLLGQLDATVEAKGEGGEVTLAFSFHGPVLDQAIAELGDMPLPPYIAVQARGRTRATTTITRPCSRSDEGSVAAPTAGLHFTAGPDGAARRARRRRCTGSRCMSGRARSCRSMPTTRRIIGCMRSMP